MEASSIIMKSVMRRNSKEFLNLHRVQLSSSFPPELEVCIQDYNLCSLPGIGV